jgi:TolB-like protein
VEQKSSQFGAFLAELKRRHVWRAAIAYGAATFVALQAAEIVLPAFGAPEPLLRILVVLALLGFPVALALAWVYEITPQGIRRTESPAAPAREPGRTASLIPRLALLGLTLVTVVAVGWWLVGSGVGWTGAGWEMEAGAPPPGTVAASAEGDGAAIQSLAVLPFESYSEAGTPDYFSAGMHEAVVAELSQITSLRVVSRTSVMRYAGARKSAPEIARELGVQGVVEGSVLRAGNRVRITVQLIHGPSDRHLWANSYERELSDVIALQSEVAQAIAREIQAEIAPASEEVPRLAAGPVDPEAHEAFLRGRFEQSKGTSEGYEQAVRYFQEAVSRDSTFAPAFAGLAGASLLLDMSDTDSALTRLPVVEEAAAKALALDPSYAEALAVLVEVKDRIDTLDVAAAGDSGRWVFRVTGRGTDTLELPTREWSHSFTEFGRQMEHVTLTGPSPTVGLPVPDVTSAARRLAAGGRVDEAVRLLRRALERDPSQTEAWDALERVYVGRGDYDRALEVREERAGRLGATAEERSAAAELERAVAEGGARGYWEWQSRQLAEAEQRGVAVSQVEFAAACVALGRYDEAIDRLERAYAQKERGLYTLAGDPVWDPLRSDPRFRNLLQRVRREFSIRRVPQSPGAPDPP